MYFFYYVLDTFCGSADISAVTSATWPVSVYWCFYPPSGFILEFYTRLSDNKISKMNSKWAVLPETSVHKTLWFSYKSTHARPWVFFSYITILGKARRLFLLLFHLCLFVKLCSPFISNMPYSRRVSAVYQFHTINQTHSYQQPSGHNTVSSTSGQ